MSTHPTRKGGFRNFVLLLFTLSVIYVLSFGPVQALYSSHRLSTPIPSHLVNCYKPLHWLYQETPLGVAMKSHDDWWSRKLKRDK